jgi:JmjC domain, hydroxylase/C5HC2 zinc finger
MWYGVPGAKEFADGLEKVFKSFLSMKMKEVPDLLHHITTMFSPRLLQNSKVALSKIIQYEGEFVITFPRAFHSGFSLGPNIGEAVNFATSDWIAYGSDANERYRSLARASVFSHDRLTFTMANHLKEQNSYMACKLLLDELERVVNEEILLRNALLSDGIRDISSLVNLPKNRLDQLDEASASYDDKRLCHACKHICFFSAVACECSHSKVSCLRHSHFMCRCPPKRKYLMMWSPIDELTKTLSNVRSHCATLKEFENNASKPYLNKKSDIVFQIPDNVVGSVDDMALHEGYEIPTCTITQQSLMCPTHTALRMREKPSEDARAHSSKIHVSNTNTTEE